MKNLTLKIPYVVQGKRSANCGPCSLKMVADYYKVRKPQGNPYTVPSLNRLCRTSKQWGTDYRDMQRVLRRLGLKGQRITLDQIQSSLASGIPIISCFMDEEGGGHYAVIKGLKSGRQGPYLVFNDSYFGRNKKRSWNDFQKQLAPLGHWLVAVSPKNP